MVPIPRSCAATSNAHRVRAACTLKKYFPQEELVNQCREIAARTGGTITLTEDTALGTKGADVVYTDVWVSMGEPDAIWEERIRDLFPYQVNRAVMENAAQPTIQEFPIL